jgi:hypothetical protein
MYVPFPKLTLNSVILVACSPVENLLPIKSCTPHAPAEGSKLIPLFKVAALVTDRAAS